MHLGCNYGFLNDFFDDASLAMSGFFILSGYSLWLAYGNKFAMRTFNKGKFYLKRLISIYPLYLIIGTLSVIMKVGAGLQTISDNLILLPVELLGFQSFFDGSLFGYAHNGGTWFISCILICYFIYPLIGELLDELRLKKTAVGVVALIVLMAYAHLLPLKFRCGDL